MKKYDCCIHEKKQGFKQGYVILPLFKVKICNDCGEVQALWGDTADMLFRYVFQWFWTGKIHITEDSKC